MALLKEAEALRQVPMFAKLEPSKLKLLAFTSESLSFGKGDILFHVGDAPDCTYVIIAGGVEIVAEAGGTEVVAGTLGKGELVGEMAVISNSPRAATIRAMEGLVALRISDEMFLRLLAENAEVALDVMRQLSEKVRRAHHQYEQLQSEIKTLTQDGGTPDEIT